MDLVPAAFSAPLMTGPMGSGVVKVVAERLPAAAKLTWAGWGPQRLQSHLWQLKPSKNLKSLMELCVGDYELTSLATSDRQVSARGGPKAGLLALRSLASSQGKGAT